MKSIAVWPKGSRAGSWIQRGADSSGFLLLKTLSSLGDFAFFCRSFLQWTFRRPFRLGPFFHQLEFIGIRSLPVILLTSAFTGMVFSLQVGETFRLFHAESLVGATVGLSLAKEIAPVFTSLMVVARAGSAMAAEIGTMQVTEQVEALSSMAVNPIHYLVVPRVLAAMLMVPCLTAVYGFVGVTGAYFVSVHLLGIPEIAFTRRLTYYLDADDFIGGLLKSAVFGFVLALVCCYRGYRTTGGAEGVGRSTTQAVVVASVCVLVLDYFLTALIINFLPEF